MPQRPTNTFAECEVARAVWQLGCNSELPHPTLADFACPTVSKAIIHHLCYQVLFLHFITSLAQARRFGQSILAPLSVKELERLGFDLAYEWTVSTSPT